MMMTHILCTKQTQGFCNKIKKTKIIVQNVTNKGMQQIC
jgi:hypothetical protein